MVIYIDKELYNENMQMLQNICNEINKDKEHLNKIGFNMTTEIITELYNNYKGLRNLFYKSILNNVCDNFAINVAEINRAQLSDSYIFRIADRKFLEISDILMKYKSIMRYNFDVRILDYLDITDNKAKIINSSDIINLFTYETKNNRQKEVVIILNSLLPYIDKLNEFDIFTNIIKSSRNLFLRNYKTGDIIGINKDAIYDIY